MTTPKTNLRPIATTLSRRRNNERVLIALPVFNERDYVADVLHAVWRYARDILVVNDGSTDGTQDVLDTHTDLRVITHPANAGYGQSLIDAFDYADRHGFEWTITIDCDHQHEPAYLPRFCREIQTDRADIISGSRYLQPLDLGTVPPPAERVAINRAITGLLNRHLNLHLTDAFCGFKAYRTRAARKLALAETGYGLPLQLWVQARRAGLQIEELPVPLIYHDRERHFAGVLEDPQKRMQYYVAIIEKELGYHVGGEIEALLCTAGQRHCLVGP